MGAYYINKGIKQKRIHYLEPCRIYPIVYERCCAVINGIEFSNHVGLGKGAVIVYEVPSLIYMANFLPVEAIDIKDIKTYQWFHLDDRKDTLIIHDHDEKPTAKYTITGLTKVALVDGNIHVFLKKSSRFKAKLMTAEERKRWEMVPIAEMMKEY